MTTIDPAPQPDSYATAQPAFPHQDLYEVRPQGATLRRGRSWLVVGIILAALIGIIASDWMSKSRPAVASAPVKGFGVGSIPDEKAQPEEPKAEKAEKEEEKKKKVAKAPPKRKSVLGMGNDFDDPSKTRAGKEVASWNPSSTGGNHEQRVANRRQSALGN